MKKFVIFFVVVLTSIWMLSACGDRTSVDKTKDESIKVVTSFTILEDIISRIGGNHVEIHNLVPIGTDPHEYEPLPEDIKAATDADVLFYNGLNLEGGENGWFFKMIDSVGQKDENIFEIAKGVEPKYLSGDDGEEHQINPHAFLDPMVGVKMVENVRDALIKVDPDHQDVYEKNAEEYLTVLKEIDKEYKEKIADIPEENRILVTSELAYQYMTDRYGLDAACVWEIDTEEQGTPEQIKQLVEFVKERNVPVLFVESNVDPRAMETVSKETGVEIYPEKIFSDEIGKKGEAGDTYVTFLKYNIEKIHDGLKGN